MYSMMGKRPLYIILGSGYMALIGLLRFSHFCSNLLQILQSSGPQELFQACKRDCRHLFKWTASYLDPESMQSNGLRGSV